MVEKLVDKSLAVVSPTDYHVSGAKWGKVVKIGTIDAFLPNQRRKRPTPCSWVSFSIP
jgi:hypothetical protein